MELAASVWISAGKVRTRPLSAPPSRVIEFLLIPSDANAALAAIAHPASIDEGCITRVKCELLLDHLLLVLSDTSEETSSVSLDRRVFSPISCR